MVNITSSEHDEEAVSIVSDADSSKLQLLTSVPNANEQMRPHTLSLFMSHARKSDRLNWPHS